MQLVQIIIKQDAPDHNKNISAEKLDQYTHRERNTVTQ